MVFRPAKKLVLASASPRRRKLLSQIGWDFEAAATDIDEVFDPRLSAAENAMHLSRLKAEAAAPSFENALILAADTIVQLQNELLGKPVDEADARRILRLLSSHSHTVTTGVTLFDRPTNRFFSFCETTVVTFRDLDDDEIIQYVKSGSPMDKAGGYGIQDDRGALFVSRIEGCYYNVIGLPLVGVYLAAREFTMNIQSS